CANRISRASSKPLVDLELPGGIAPELRRFSAITARLAQSGQANGPDTRGSPLYDPCYLTSSSNSKLLLASLNSRCSFSSDSIHLQSFSGLPVMPAPPRARASHPDRNSHLLPRSRARAGRGVGHNGVWPDRHPLQPAPR